MRIIFFISNIAYIILENKYRLKHGFECHTGYNVTVATSAGPRAEVATVTL